MKHYHLSLLLLVGALAGCGSKRTQTVDKSKDKEPEELVMQNNKSVEVKELDDIVDEKELGIPNYEKEILGFNE